MTRLPMPTTILVVEDNAATSELLVDLLSLEGNTTRVAASGAAALAELAEHPVSVVLLDRRLPDLDGLAVCRQVRQSIDATVPIILLTADYNAELEASARNAGVTDYFPKPFPPDVLLDRVAALVHA